MNKQKALSKPPRYYWKQCYEMPNGHIHWALCDTHSDARDVPIVSDYHMVLLFSAKKCLDGKPLGKQPLPELIVKLLNEHFAAKTASVDPVQSAIVTHIGLCSHYNQNTFDEIEKTCINCPSFVARNCPLRMLLASMSNLTAWEHAPKCN